MNAAIEAGPHAGKTTLINEFAAAGFPVVNEKAKEVILGGGPHPKDDHVAFQYEVLRLQLAHYRRMREQAGWRLSDRGVFSGVVYRLIHGWKVPDFFSLKNLHALGFGGYDVCLLLDPVPGWEDDGCRYEDADFTKDLAPVYRWVYGKCGIPLVSIPMGTPEERFACALKVLKVQARRRQVIRPDAKTAARFASEREMKLAA